MKIRGVMSESRSFGSLHHHRDVQDYIEKMISTRGVAPNGTKWHQFGTNLLENSRLLKVKQGI